MSMLPINNIIVLPGSKLWLQNSIYTQTTDKAPLKGEKVTLLAQKEEDPQKPLSADTEEKHLLVLFKVFPALRMVSATSWGT